MLAMRKISLFTLFVIGSAAQALGQEASPKREPDVPYVPTPEEVVAGMLKAADVKKMLAPVMDFEKRSATELYAETLSPEVQKAIKDKRVLEGMDRDQVLLAVGRPVHKSRETKEGLELEDWVYGKAPGRITFVTFNGNKVIKVKESYAGLGTEAAPTLPTN